MLPIRQLSEYVLLRSIVLIFLKSWYNKVTVCSYHCVIFHLDIKFFPRYAVRRTPVIILLFLNAVLFILKAWFLSRKHQWQSNLENLPSFLNLKAFYCAIHIGHVKWPLVLRLDNISYAGKSLMVHISAAFIWNVRPVEMSNVSIQHLTTLSTH